MTGAPLEKRLEELANHVERLQHRVDELATGMVRVATEVDQSNSVQDLAGQVERLQHRVDELAHGMVRVATEVVDRPGPAGDEEDGAGAERGDNLVAWAGTSALLPRISTLCFLLVVALALRTVTDSGIIGTPVGSLIGMVYAAAIMLVGWLRYGKASPIAPVFSLSGALLMYSIVIETHAHFGSLPTLPAYLLLAGTGTVMALTSRRSGSAAPMAVGTVGMCAAGVAMTFSAPSFVPLAALLFLANVIAYRTAPLLKRDWLRWTVFAVTGTIMQVWGVRLSVSLASPEIPSGPLTPSLFIPFAALFGAFYFLSAILAMLRSGEGRKRVFDYVVPSMSAFVFFTAARHVAAPLWESALGIGVAGAIVSAAHLGVASWMVRGRKLSAPEFNSFTFAGVVLLVLSLSAATGALLAAAPLLSIAAFHLAVISERWKSGGTRLISYSLQAFVAVALAAVIGAGQGRVPSWLAALAAGAVGLVALLHYRWCRRQPPPEDSVVFSRFDTKDLGAVSLLMASLTGWFFFLRTGVYAALTAGSAGADIGNAFSGAQTLLLNAAAMGCLVLSFTRRNSEIRNVAILLTLVGGAKVFFHDLVAVEGVARVLSVFSFGVVAAVASWVLGRWQRSGPGQEEGRGSESGSSVENGKGQPA